MIYQIELQLCNHAYLARRMLYNWSAIYKAQLTEGMVYEKLNPVISIWLVVDRLFKDSPDHHHCFELYDKKNQYVLTDHCVIHILELAKWHKHSALSQADSWLYFFKEAKGWNALPNELNTPIMRSAMDTLKQFSEKELEYHKYQARQNFIREQMSFQHDFDKAQQAFEETKQKLEQAGQQLEQKEQQLEQSEQQLEQSEQQLEQSEQQLEQKEQQLEQSEHTIGALKAKLRAAGLSDE